MQALAEQRMESEEKQEKSERVAGTTVTKQPCDAER